MKRILASSIGLISIVCALNTGPAFAQSGGGGKRMMERFMMLDANGDEQIARSEASTWHDTVFTTMDANDNGQLTREEYMAVRFGAGAKGPRYAERQAQKDAAFTIMDADGDGIVSQAQFIADRADKFTSADTDEDGFVSMSEFIAARRSQK